MCFNNSLMDYEANETGFNPPSFPQHYTLRLMDTSGPNLLNIYCSLN